MWSIIATWDFAQTPVSTVAQLLGDGASALDAVVKCGSMVEDDESVDTVGYGGLPNARGELELDAAIMDGRALDIGAVCALKRHRHALEVARKLLYQRHNMLVGTPADEFAEAHGLPPTEMLTENALEKYRKLAAERPGELFGHDTVGIVALGRDGNIAAGTSTSGIGLKMPGRVGDSPLPGCGYYADNASGGAAATGMGEDIMRTCTCFYACELLRAGASAQQAADGAVLRAHQELTRRGRESGNVALVVMDKSGNFAGAANHEGFAFAAASETCPPKLYKVQPVITRQSSNTKLEIYNNIAP